MTSRNAPTDSVADFAAAVADLAGARVRPLVRVAEIPAPARLAPHAVALSAEVVLTGEDEPAASGRFVVLYDPKCPAAWDGRAWRIVTFARARLEPELAEDPMLGDVGWSWLTETLEVDGATQHALGGTVTRVVSQSYAALSDRETTVEMEIRASWSPRGDDLRDHLSSWADVLCQMAGLPPLPDGVAALPLRRG